MVFELDFEKKLTHKGKRSEITKYGLSPFFVEPFDRYMIWK
jgi:hypothetical protein